MVGEGLWRWSARHPEWQPGQGWEPDVWCVYVETPDAVAVVDPLVPADEEDRFWRALDRDVERLGLPVTVLLTCPWHARSAAAVEKRYGATRELPPAIEAISAAPEEVAFWLPAHAALLAGDVLVGDGGGLRIHPEWYRSPAGEVLAAVGGLRSLPLERILPSHGEAVLEGAREALERALAHAQSSSATDR